MSTGPGVRPDRVTESSRFAAGGPNALVDNRTQDLADGEALGAGLSQGRQIRRARYSSCSRFRSNRRSTSATWSWVHSIIRLVPIPVATSTSWFIGIT